MPDRRLSRTRIAASLCVGLAAWSSLGVLTFGGGDGGAARVGLLPPWWALAVLVGAALAIFAALRVPDDAARPWCATAVLVVPWLPVPLPTAALAWAGPFGAIIWAGAAAASLVAAWPALSARPHWRAAFTGPRAPWIAAALALAIYVAASVRIAPVIPGGDEPHYLIITQSLLKDGDLRIENNHKQGDYLAYAGGTLRPDYLRRGLDLEIYSIHLPGVSVLVAPAFAIGGYPLTKLWLAALAALGSMVAWRAAFALTASAPAAWFAWASTALTAPFLFLAFTVYPDGPGSACVIAALAALVSLSRRGDRSVRWWWMAGLAPAALPWLHPRFAVLAGAIGVVFVLRALGERRRAAAIAPFLSTPLVSALGWFGYYYVIYGSPDPSVAYGHYTQMAAANALRGLPGLLFDQQFGLLAVAPVYALAAAGVAAWIARERRLPLEWLLIVVPYAAASAAYHMWWGGHSSAARFLGSEMLACALPVAIAFRSAQSVATRVTQALLLGVSLSAAALLVWLERGRLIFNVRDGFAQWAVWAGRSADLARGLPSWFRTDSGTAIAVASVWVVLAVAAWLLLRVIVSRRRMASGTAASWAVVLCAVLVPAAMTASWRLEGASGAAPGAGQLTLLRVAAAGPSSVGVSYAPLSIGPAATVVPRMRIDGASAAGRPAWAWFFLPRVPAGRYRVWFENRNPNNRFDVDLVIGRGDAAIETWRFADLQPGPVSRDLALPRAVRSIAIRGDRAIRGRLGSIVLEPVDVGPGDDANALIVTAARRYGDVVVMAVGESVYLEPPGLWTEGKTTAEMLISGPEGWAQQRLRVRAGAVATGVVLQSGEWRDTLALSPGEVREVAVPKGAGPFAILRVTTDNGFRPSAVDRASTDTRFLGAWIEIAD